jgi:hypothetical protein
MRKSRTEPTTAKNLEEKFDRGEEVLDYFDVRKARVIRPRATSPGGESEACVSGEAKFSECRGTRKISDLSEA